ncbi:MAG: hypothetical protein P4M11_01055 [Candidatus Pacebacteria bacterium]|nr:hypothetical protein [Candidatus Paceibacterota bacterium]
MMKLVEYVRTSADNAHQLALLHDLPGMIGCDKPPMLGSYRPDLYATDAPTTTVIVGEAKTAHDLETAHSKEQIRSFLRHLAMYPGSQLILAVPWSSRARAQQLLAVLSKDSGLHNVKLVVIDDMQEIA